MKPKRLTRSAVKESLDNLPTGICFFNKAGLPVLCNRVMYDLVLAMTGRDLQSLPELVAALVKLPKESTATRDGDIILLSDQSAWRFSSRHIMADAICTEYTATNVTELYQRKKDLQKSTKEHEQIAQNMHKIMNNVTAITREEEILTMKMQIHSKVGYCLQHLRKFYVDGCPIDEKNELVKQLQKVTIALRGEIGKVDGTGALDELLHASKIIGVNVDINGEPPEDSRAQMILVMTLRECITNVQRHANGNHVYVSIMKENAHTRFIITNNGDCPEKKIVEGGGLTSLRKKIEKVNGTMKVQSSPEYKLIVEIPIECEE